MAHPGQTLSPRGDPSPPFQWGQQTSFAAGAALAAGAPSFAAGAAFAAFFLAGASTCARRAGPPQREKQRGRGSKCIGALARGEGGGGGRRAGSGETTRLHKLIQRKVVGRDTGVVHLVAGARETHRPRRRGRRGRAGEGAAAASGRHAVKHALAGEDGGAARLLEAHHHRIPVATLGDGSDRAALLEPTEVKARQLGQRRRRR